VKHVDSDSAASASRTSLLHTAFNHFSASYLATKDIHTLVASFDTDVRKTVLSSYFHALAALEDRKIPNVSRPLPSALFTASQENEASIFALFGGQGTNEVYLDELQTLYDLYTPYVAPFVQAMTRDVLEPLASSSESPFFTHGLDVISWLSGALPRPPLAYQASVPVSFPLIGLTQLSQYLVAFKVLSMSPEELLSHIAGATGHSQGIVSAVAVAASTTFDSFMENSRKALRWLLLAGSRSQTIFPLLSLEQNIVADSVEGGEGVPSSMLSITGLTLQDLSPHIEKTNKYLPENSQIGVSLHNGVKAFVVTGPARALYGLVTSLRKIRAPSGLDQSKTPFSQRKPVFSIRFLVVGVPFHSRYLADAVDQLLGEDLEGEELWTKDQLGIPVLNTHDGNFFRSPSDGTHCFRFQGPI
jgi:fatty acid synthase subunit alpha, fungi type